MTPPPLKVAEHQKQTFRVPVPAPTPPKIVLVAVEGWGKTSLGAAIDGASILMPATETGYLTLLGAGRVTARPAMVTDSWSQTLSALDGLAGAKALVIDELTGFERQCQEFVVANEFQGQWKMFESYGKGTKAVARDWTAFLLKLERLTIPVLMLSHCRIETFKNPMGDDFDRYVSAANKDTWGATRRWADACLFGTFRTIVDRDGKGVGGTERVIYAEHSDAVDAKNRYGLPAEIACVGDSAAIWDTLKKGIK